MCSALRKIWKCKQIFVSVHKSDIAVGMSARILFMNLRVAVLSLRRMIALPATFSAHTATAMTIAYNSSKAMLGL